MIVAAALIVAVALELLLLLLRLLLLLLWLLLFLLLQTLQVGQFVFETRGFKFSDCMSILLCESPGR